MLAKVFSAAILGVDGYLVDVEVDISFGLPGVTVVGLPDAAVQESRERVRSAIKNNGYTFPTYRTTVNMAPADTRKNGPVFDLAIALGMLAASEQIPQTHLDQFVMIGELSLDGNVRGVQGVLPFAIATQQANKKGLIVPYENAAEAALIEGLDIYPVQNLKEAIQIVCEPENAQIYKPQHDMTEERFMLDYSEVKGQNYAKRGLEIAAAGAHNLIMIGPPGSGKTMLARRLPSILPPMTLPECLETSKIYSITGKMSQGNRIIRQRPFRSPHHSISSAGLVGGSSIPKPGEVSLAHNGVLFLDELLEFRREVLEVLREPLEDHVVSISRAQMRLSFPANFILIASMNPCMCGYRGDLAKACVCTVKQIDRYWNKLSGPLLDRVDIHLDIPRLQESELMQRQDSESSQAIRERVVQAHHIQLKRFEGSGIHSNSQMSPKHLKAYCQLDEIGQGLLQQAIRRLSLSARAYDRILKVSRTIADLDGETQIHAQHLAEAIQFRTLDRQHMMAA